MLFTFEQLIVLAVVLLAGYLLGFASRPSARKWKRKVAAQSESFTAYHTDAEDRVRAARQRAKGLEDEAVALRADRAEAERTIATLRREREQAERAIAELKTAPPAPKAEPEPEPARPTLALVAPPVAPVIAEETPDHPTASEPRPVAQSAARPAFGFASPPHTDAPDGRDDAPLAMTPTPSAGVPAPIGPAEPEMPSQGWFGGSNRDDLTRLRGVDGALDTRLFGLGVLRFEDIEKLSDEDEMALEQRLALPAGYITREQWRAQAALLRAGKDEEYAERFGEEAAEA